MKVYLTTDGTYYGIMVEHPHGSYFTPPDYYGENYRVGGWNADAVARESLMWKTRKTAMKKIKEMLRISNTTLETYRI